MIWEATTFVALREFSPRSDVDRAKAHVRLFSLVVLVRTTCSDGLRVHRSLFCLFCFVFVCVLASALLSVLLVRLRRSASESIKK